MGRSADNTGRSSKDARHVRLHHWVMQTPAWKSLSGEQRAIYIEIAARYRGTGSNNGSIPYSVREAADSLHIGKSTAARHFEVLQDRGFIIAVRRGGFSYKQRHATEWRLTEFPCDVTHELPSKEFARWTSETQNTVPPPTSKVLVAEPIGTHSGTDPSRIAADGPTTGTVGPISADPRYLQRATSSLPGVGALPSSSPARPAPLRPPRKARRAKRALNGAVASEPGGRPDLTPVVSRTPRRAPTVRPPPPHEQLELFMTTTP
jgi:DNA-binding transcriptional regulator YhcF (GntR family)